MGIRISGVSMGNITGGPSALKLEDLNDVSIASPITGNYVRFNGTSSEWENVTLDADLASYLSTNTVNATITDDTTTNATMYPTWVTATTGNLPQKTSSTKFSFNPSTGLVSATGFNATSTKRVKKAIKNLSQTYLSRFSELKPREYDRKDYVAHEFGFVAEEMALIYPEIVGLDDQNKPSGIDYGKLSAILTAKVQEQESTISTQKSRIDVLEERIGTIMQMIKGGE